MPVTTLETNRKTANSIYLETYINDEFEFREATYARLLNIANQTPYEGGYGVFTARIMLDYDPDQNGVNWRMANMPKQEDEIYKIRIYPNPAKDVLFVEVISDLDSYNANIKIYNTIGQLIATQQLNEKMEFVDLKSLKTGMYIYNIEYDNGYSEKGKFIVE